MSAFLAFNHVSYLRPLYLLTLLCRLGIIGGGGGCFLGKGLCGFSNTVGVTYCFHCRTTRATALYVYKISFNKEDALQVDARSARVHEMGISRAARWFGLIYHALSDLPRRKNTSSLCRRARFVEGKGITLYVSRCTVASNLFAAKRHDVSQQSEASPWRRENSPSIGPSYASCVLQSVLQASARCAGFPVLAYWTGKWQVDQLTRTEKVEIWKSQLAHKTEKMRSGRAGDISAISTPFLDLPCIELNSEVIILSNFPS